MALFKDAEAWLAHPDLYYVRYEKVKYPVGLLAIIGVKSFNGRIISQEVLGVEEITDYKMRRAAYNNQGALIGPVELARWLCRDLGIVPDKIAPSRKICTIGKSRKDGEWYGWSHRVVTSFKIGDVVKKDGGFGRYLKLSNDLLIDTEDLARDMAVTFAEAVA